MEFSSPLAAMRPQPCPAWGNRRDLPGSRVMYQSYQTCGPSSFDFKTMSMHQRSARPDYFTVRPLRGSSPTSSLTADMDANFHIDKSPQAPTPRRSLFTADVFKPREIDVPLATPPMEVEPATTPDVPSSSPGGFDAMEISPLPHKPPHFQVTLPSPTPEGTPGDSDFDSPDLLSPTDFPASMAFAVQSPTFLQLPERKRPVTRPTLSRTKGLSFSSIPTRPTSSENKLPPFRFGSVASNGLSCSSTPSLLETIDHSPIDDVRSSGFHAMLPLPRRTSISNANRGNASPSTGHVRKPSGGRPAFVRPQRKLMRRSLSMFQHPDDIMKEEHDNFEPPSVVSPSIMDIEPEHTLKLPHFVPEDEPDGLPRITQATMVDVLESKYSSHYERVLVIDCRFEYEYSGGHIENAVNFNDRQVLANELFGENALSSLLPPSAPACSPSNTLLIFHCEYSVHRAPLTAKYVRGYDRNVNAAHYPRLTYPEMYILDGGYSKFFEQHRAKCYPQSYVEMNDQRHELDCERGMAKVKQARQKLFRHQTFAFGQHDHDDGGNSPTAQGRSHVQRSQSTFSVGSDIAEGIGMSYQRRMASY